MLKVNREGTYNCVTVSLHHFPYFGVASVARINFQQDNLLFVFLFSTASFLNRDCTLCPVKTSIPSF
jgi:hypothetical protein